MVDMQTRLTKGQLLHYWGYQEKCNAVEDYKSFYKLGTTGDHLCFFVNSEEILVVIDATEGKLDSAEWQSNFNFSPPIHGFHNGFYTTANLFMPMITKELKKLVNDNPDKKVIVQGHSRGGGIAPILDMMLGLAGIDNTTLITFCAPRCATKSAIPALKSNGTVHHRVEAKLDAVDNVPPKFTFFPFCIWKHLDTFSYDLPGVKGNDHLEVRAAIEAM